jgi:hypothetical protein
MRLEAENRLARQAERKQRLQTIQQLQTKWEERGIFQGDVFPVVFSVPGRNGTARMGYVVCRMEPLPGGSEALLRLVESDASGSPVVSEEAEASACAGLLGTTND